MPNYNISFIDNSTGMLPLLQGVNDNTGGLFFISVLLVIWVLGFMTFKNSGTSDSFLTSSFIVSILAGVLFGADLLGGGYLAVPVTAVVITLLIKLWGDI